VTTIVRRTPAHTVTVTAVADLTPRMRRVTLAGPSLRGLQARPAQDVQLLLTTPSGSRVKRRYTIRAARPGLGEIDVDGLRHGHGPGSDWVTEAQPGQHVDILGPLGKLELQPADWHLFVGDEAALPAFCALAEALPDGPRAVAVVEVGDTSDELPIHRADTTWLHRGDADPGRVELLAAGLGKLSVPPGDGRAYLLGESRAVVALRPLVTALGVPDERIYLKGYWNLGRAGRGIPRS
jgi:NADPH-dependent ferric siderophore reductase